MNHLSGSSGDSEDCCYLEYYARENGYSPAHFRLIQYAGSHPPSGLLIRMVSPSRRRIRIFSACHTAELTEESVADEGLAPRCCGTVLWFSERSRNDVGDG